MDKLGESVIDTVESAGERGVIDEWGTWYKQPSMGDYKKALLEDEERKSKMDEKEEEEHAPLILVMPKIGR